MGKIYNRLITILMCGAMATTPYVVGFYIGFSTLTASTILLAITFAFIALARISNDLPLVPAKALKEPAVISALVYMSIGLLSGFCAQQKMLFYKEVVQRTIIIWIPFYCTAIGLRRLDQAKKMVYAYLPSAGLLALCSAGAAFSGGFAKPVYVLGLHKNMTAGCLGTMVVICAAYLLTNRPKMLAFKKLRLDNRILFGGGAALGLLGIVAAQGRAGVVSVIAAVFIMLVGLRTKPTVLVKFAVLCVVGIVVVVKLLPEQAVEHIVSTQTHSANQVRLMLWGEMFNNFMKNPFLASGWGNAYVDEHGWFYYDLACVLLFDWMQMGLCGAVALLAMIFCSVKLGLDNARKVDRFSVAEFVNLAGLGILTAKFTHGMLDTFWIGRGHSLHTWLGVGMCLFVKLWLDQTGKSSKRRYPARVLAGSRR